MKIQFYNNTILYPPIIFSSHIFQSSTHNHILIIISAISRFVYLYIILYAVLYNSSFFSTHNRVIIDAIKKKYNNILVLEDDVFFHKNFFDEFESKIEKIPENWNLLYLGAVQKKWSNLNIIKNKNYYIPDRNTNGAFAYGINKNLFEELKNICFELTEPFDKCLHKLFKFNSTYVFNPNLIISNIERSKIHRSKDMNKFSKIFKWNLDDYNLRLYENNDQDFESSI